MDLLIVESPTKAKTLERFLGDEFQVLPTMGHIRDLPKSKMGVDVEAGFEPQYVIVPRQKKTVAKIKKAVKKADRAFLATDPDREGEAIAYHVGVVCDQSEMTRISFHEITQEAIKTALEKGGEINEDLVEAQVARRILDRLVGYKLSPVLWKKVRRGLSAGRVQSVAVRLVVEREREIEAFEEQSFWRVYGKFSSNDKEIDAELVAFEDEKYEVRNKMELFAGSYTTTQTTITSQQQAKDIIAACQAPFEVTKIKRRKNTQHPYPPFTTSNLQQTAYRFLRFTSGRTMRAAQQLYEEGLITYHRTDSTNLAETAIKQARKLIKKKYGEKYLPAKPRHYKTKARVAQEAHEAVRPTDFSQEKTSVGRDADRLYQLIWQRATACQMASAKTQTLTLTISSGDYDFAAKGRRTLFDGFWKALGKKLKQEDLPALSEGDKVEKKEVFSKEFATNPPPRYSEASLIAALEKEGIGRPSTYAPIIATIRSRHYVRKENRQFEPTVLGKTTNDFLVDHFPKVLDLPFTAHMEESLDDIANGEKERQEILEEFYQPFVEKVEKVEEEAERVKIPVEKTGKKCPECEEGELVVRVGKYGKFLSCSRFPDCKYTANYVEEVEGVECPDCGGKVIIKKTKKGRKFYGCSNYPDCDWASWHKPKSD